MAYAPQTVTTNEVALVTLTCGLASYLAALDLSTFHEVDQSTVATYLVVDLPYFEILSTLFEWILPTAGIVVRVDSNPGVVLRSALLQLFLTNSGSLMERSYQDILSIEF